MNIKCEKCGQVYEAGPEYTGKTVQCQCGAEIAVPEDQGKKFVVPKITKWFFEIGKLIIALGIVFTVIGIIAVCADGVKKLFYPVMAASAVIPGILMMGGGKALEYLAEIAFNTRKR